MAPGPDAMWETVLAVQQLAGSGPLPPAFGQWRPRALADLAERQLTAAGRLLAALAPATARDFPDFLTPGEAVDGLEAGLDGLRGTAPDRLRRELGWLWRDRRPTPWMRGLAARNPERMDELTGTFRALHATVVQPDWVHATAGVDEDRRFRATTLADGGVDALLQSLRPLAAWRPPVLEMRYPRERDLHLAGRGIRLVPSFFCWRTPVALADPALRPVLVYPISHETATTRPPADSRPTALAKLVGRTRARVLAACEKGITTGELGRALGVSAASASEHVKALRAASLASSRRDGGRVVHVLSPLGVALLHGRLPASSS
ncbi:ArsR/SmtB family transcription factor [Streptomyces sp. NRRL F-5126]|uniref:ArsR/SmtB family transcription factor n=1 Tax=Streptomyces sp. NRRL F-5126 TaxID=1463857 RepID=UPI001F1C1F24|nr:winged helix-turn-helix domain-containing protein [Streptomyces sp. NRRL F-5126]